MALFAPRSPVDDRERRWIEKMLAWCSQEFGRPALAADFLVPTPEFFPGSYTGTAQDVYDLVDLVRAYLRIAADEIDVELYDQSVPYLPKALTARSTIAGHYRIRDGRGVVSVALDDAPDPRRVVAVAAHELCHHLLLFPGRVGAHEPDHEPLTDLLTVHLGLGVFTANAAFTFSQGARGWQRRQLGYLNQPMFGYALAYTARTRGEADPAWARYLDVNPRGYFKQAARYLARRSSAVSG